jgi:hypothetical protein
MADFVVKITEDYTNETIQAQFVNPFGIAYVEELTDTNDMKFTLDINDPQIGSIIEWAKVSLYEIVGNSDILVWSGCITTPENDFESIDVICSDEKRFLQKKIIHEDKNWSGTPIADVIQELVDEANARSGGMGGNLTFETNLVLTVTKEFNRGTTYFEIMQDLAELLNAQWKVTHNKIIFQESIGEDKTSGVNFVEFISNREIGIGNTIIAYKAKRLGNNIVTAVTGKNDAGYSEQQENTDQFGFLEGSQSFGEGDLAEQTERYLDEKSVSQIEIELTLAPNAIGYRQVNVGDLVSVRIEHGSPLVDLEENLIILEKSVEVTNGQPNLNVKVGAVKKSVAKPKNFFAKMDKRIKALELK